MDIIITIISVIVCYMIAKKQGYNKLLAIGLSAFFPIMSLIGYPLVMYITNKK